MRRKPKKDDGIGYTTGHAVAPAEASNPPCEPGHLAEEQAPVLVAGPEPLAIADDAPDTIVVWTRSRRGFVRCGRRFGEIKTAINLSDISPEEIETIKSTPALCWEFQRTTR